MNQRIFFSLSLTCVVIVLCAVFVFSEKPAPTPEATRVSEINTDRITQITIKRNNQVDIAFEKKGHNWIITSPLQTRANVLRINAILDLPQSRSFSQVRHAAQAATLYQLDRPLLTLQLGDYRFLFGGTDPLDERRYLLFEDTIHLVSDSLFHQLRQPASFFASPKLLPDDEIVSHILFGEHLVVRAGNDWVLSPPAEGVDAAFLELLVNSWQLAEAGRVFAYSPAQELAKITVSFASGRAVVFDLVSLTPALVLGRADLGLQYEMGKSVAGKLLLPARKPSQQ